MEKARKKQLGFQFWKVENKDEALYLIKQNSYGFLTVGGLLLILGFFIGTAAFIDGAVFLILGSLLLFLQSRVVSVLLLLASMAGVVITIMNKMGITHGGSNFFLAILVLYFAVSSVYLTFYYQKLEQTKQEGL
jgi:hypothetical protein